MVARNRLSRRELVTLGAAGLVGAFASMPTRRLARCAGQFPGLKWLSFDIIGTAFDVHGSLLAGIAALAEQYSLKIDASEYTDGWIAGYAAGVGAVNRGEAAWTPPDQLLRDAFLAMLDQDGIAAPRPAVVDAFVDLWRKLAPWPDVAGGLKRLHGQYGLAILSNMSVATQTALSKHAGLPFSPALSAETVQAYKPRPAVYRMAIKSLQVRPEQIMMVAAHKYDLDAAQALGFKTAFVARPLELGPDGSVDTTPDPAFDINATDFDDLATKLGK